MPHETLKIDWEWTKEMLLKAERIRSIKEACSKDALLIAADESIKKARSLVKPRMVSIEKKVLSIHPGKIKIEGPFTLTGKKLSSHMKGAIRVNIFLVTAGDAIEKTATGLMKKGDFLRGYLLDRIGSFAVESLAENFEGNLRRIHKKKGFNVSMRFSPGYCGWPIEEQFKLEKILNFSKAKVRLTKSCVMVPQKSISAMVGIAPGKVFAKTQSQCSICNKGNCDYRRDN